MFLLKLNKFFPFIINIIDTTNNAVNLRKTTFATTHKILQLLLVGEKCMKKIIFEGAAVALVTPFKNSKVDYTSLKKLLNFQVQNKTKAIVVLGTTGEPSTISDPEKREIVTFCKQNLPKNVKLIVGSGGNNTKKVIEDSLLYKQLGADAL